MSIALYACAIILIIAFFLSLYRLWKGPTLVDRAVAVDVVTAASIGLVVIEMALHDRTDLLPLLVVLTLVGFISSTTIARFSVPDQEAARRVLSEDDVRVLLAAEELRRDTGPTVHDPDEESNS